MKSVRPPSLYTRLGGAKAIELMISSFYTRLLADPLLAPVFQHVTIDRLHAMQRSFLTMATGGPENRGSQSLAQLMEGFAFTAEHYTQFARHLLDTLAAFGITESETREVVTRIRACKSELAVTTAS